MMSPHPGKLEETVAGERPHRRAEWLPVLGIFPLVLIAVLALGGCGEGNPSVAPERQEVESSLSAWRSLESYDFRIRLETMVGVSGHEVGGAENGEGSFRGGDFSVRVKRASPEGEDNFVILSRNGALFRQREGEEREIPVSELPNPLYRPQNLLDMVDDYLSLSEEGEEEMEGARCRLYELVLPEERAADVLPARAWAYFSSLDYSLRALLWISDPSRPPAALRLVLSGTDRVEKLERLRMTLTFTPLPEGREESP